MIEYHDDVPIAATVYYPDRGAEEINVQEVIPYVYPLSKQEYDNLLIRMSMQGDEEGDEDDFA